MKTDIKFLMFFLVLSLNINLFSQQLSFNSNLSLSRNNISLGYEKNLNKWNLGFSLGVGYYGKATFSQPEIDGYSGIYQVFHPGYFKRQGFKHNFKGFSTSIVINRQIWGNEKLKLKFGLGSSFYRLTDYFEYYYTVTIDETDKQTDFTKTKQNVISLDLGVYLERKISDNLNFEFGFFNPSYIILKNNKITYNPIDNKLPLKGFEPNIVLSIKYKIKKNEKE
jgi:hypothetical protein